MLLTKYKPIMTYQMVLNIMSTNPLVYYLETDFWLQKYIISCRFCKLPPPILECFNNNKRVFS